MIDEIDKMGADFRGDPSSAMLEVLDPEQNATFRDHYLDLPFDLSQRALHRPRRTCSTRSPVRCATAWRSSSSRATPRRRSSQIARRYLVPQADRAQRPDHEPGSPSPTPALRAIISDYTREAGVRNLEREIGSVARKVARQFAEGTAKRKVAVTEPRVRELLGKPRFHYETSRRTARPGVATGLAWTPVGGDILFIEATAMPGSGKLMITGQLGDVMKESAQAALSYVRSNAPSCSRLAEDWFAQHDLHIHVPAGAIPKDGPSAGVTMATALASLLSGRKVRADTAMTGEITLTGQVLPIGGLKEKALAAQRDGIKRVIAPELNAQDIDEIPEHLRKNLEFVFVGEIGEVLELGLERARARQRTRLNAVGAG